MSTEEKEKNTKGLSRRALLKSAVATGVATAAISGGLRKARADSFSGHSYASELSDEKLLWMYKTMVKAREFDQGLAGKMALGDPALEGRRPSLHNSSGQEAVAVGVIAAMTMDDWCYATHRCTVHDVARGMDMGKMFGTAIYKANGYTLGRGNHFHISSMEHKVPNMAGLIGTEPLIATGTAYAQMVRNQRDGRNDITVKFSGDGDYNCPDTLLALNEAALFKVPIIFVVENNGYQIWNRTEHSMAIRDVAQRGKGFGVPSYVVDGQDVISVYNVAKRVIDEARAGKGPSLVEAKTYRYFHHSGASGHDPKRGLGAYGLSYRSDKELMAWLAKDPIKMFKQTLLNYGTSDAAGLARIEADAKKEVADAWAWNLRQPNPKSEDALKLVYANGLESEKTALPRQLADCPLYV